MTGEAESQPEESRASSEPGEGREDREQQRLDDATLDPGALIEQSGDIRQAEDVQATFTAVVENIPKTPEGEAGHPPEPPDLDHSPYPEEVLAATETDSLKGQMPTVRDDLDQATSSTGEPGGDEATPINLPGPEALAAQDAGVACDGSNKDEALPLDGNVRVSRRFTWSAQDISATPQPIPNEAGEAGATPINLALDADLASGGGIAGSGGEQVGATPINLPREANVVSDGMESVMGGSAVAAGAGKAPGGAVEVPLPGTAGEDRTFDNTQEEWEDELNSIGDDGKLADFDLQDALGKQQQITTMLSNLSKAAQETAQGIIRNMK